MYLQFLAIQGLNHIPGSLVFFGLYCMACALLSFLTRDQTRAPYNFVFSVFFFPPSPEVFTTENNLHISVPTQFKIMLFKGQHEFEPVFVSRSSREYADDGINEKSAQGTSGRHGPLFCSALRQHSSCPGPGEGAALPPPRGRALLLSWC